MSRLSKVSPLPPSKRELKYLPNPDALAVVLQFIALSLVMASLFLSVRY